MTFWIGENYGDSKKVSGCQGMRGTERSEQVEHRSYLGQWNSSLWYVMVDTQPYPFVKTQELYNIKSKP